MLSPEGLGNWVSDKDFQTEFSVIVLRNLFAKLCSKCLRVMSERQGGAFKATGRKSLVDEPGISSVG